jgi:hypothetical protein
VLKVSPGKPTAAESPKFGLEAEREEKRSERKKKLLAKRGKRVMSTDLRPTAIQDRSWGESRACLVKADCTKHSAPLPSWKDA